MLITYTSNTVCEHASCSAGSGSCHVFPFRPSAWHGRIVRLFFCVCSDLFIESSSLVTCTHLTCILVLLRTFQNLRAPLRCPPRRTAVAEILATRECCLICVGYYHFFYLLVQSRTALLRLKSLSIDCTFSEQHHLVPLPGSNVQRVPKADAIAKCTVLAVELASYRESLSQGCTRASECRVRCASWPRQRARSRCLPYSKSPCGNKQKLSTSAPRHI